VKKSKKGLVLVNTIVFGTIATILIIGLTGWFGVTIKGSRSLSNREQAFHIAEAGVEYYRWHLAHDQDDYKDGKTTNGPYVHDFFNKDGEKIGQFSLTITPPASGSTVVTIQSTGKVEADPSISRTIKAQLAIPSFAKYAVAADADMRFGEGTEVFGPIHSNGGIRFDGLAHNLISSSKQVYDDPDHAGANEFGVHTHLSPVDPLPPASVPTRSDVFEAGREFPVPAIDFDGMISDLASIKSKAQTGGRYFAASGFSGYLVEFRNNDTFRLHRVRSLVSPHSSCTNYLSQDGWGSWSVGNTTLLGTYNNPANGLIFIEDNVWVQGQINTARITLAAGRFPDTPSNRRSITVNNDLKYTNYDGSDVIALIAQNNINVGLVSETDLQIDAALVAQHGRVGRYYYIGPYNQNGNKPGCATNDVKSKITLNGMIGSKERYGFAYTDGNGYVTRNINYDANLLYSPPPDFPLTSDQYEVISWEEVE
jgi:hypothetical protein